MTVQTLPALTPTWLRQLSTAADALQPDIVVASGDCFLGFLGRRLANRSGARFVFDVYDDYRTFGAYRAFLGWDALGYLCGRADLVMYASRAVAERHAYDSPYVLVPNGVDGAVFRPMSMPEARASLGLGQSSRIVGYFGSMAREHGVNVLIQAVQQLRTRDPDTQLLLCGKKDSGTDVSADGVVYHGFVSHDRMPAYINACDVVSLPYLRGAFLDSASSCKIAEYLMCQRPIAATRTPNFVQNFPEQAERLDELLVEPGDSSALATSIDRQLREPVVVEPPDGMTWQSIAAETLERFTTCLVKSE
jgi:glycosyltransferase involved in cell wall biosynthesis